MFRDPLTIVSPNSPHLNKPVELELAKADEQGRTVHERCYLLKVRKVNLIPPLNKTRYPALGGFFWVTRARQASCAKNPNSSGLDSGGTGLRHTQQMFSRGNSIGPS